MVQASICTYYYKLSNDEYDYVWPPICVTLKKGPNCPPFTVHKAGLEEHQTKCSTDDIEGVRHVLFFLDVVLPLSDGLIY